MPLYDSSLPGGSSRETREVARRFQEAGGVAEVVNGPDGALVRTTALVLDPVAYAATLRAAAVKAGAQVVQHDGEVLTPANIGGRLATRDLMQDIRSANPFHQGGGAGFSKADRARFLQSLDRVLGAAQRGARG